MLLCVEFEDSVDASPNVRFFLTYFILMLRLLFAHILHAAVGKVKADLLEVQLADTLVLLAQLRLGDEACRELVEELHQAVLALPLILAVFIFDLEP